MQTGPDNVQAELAGRSVNFEAIANRVARHPKGLSQVFAGLAADEAKIKYGCLKVLRVISDTHPAVLYSEFHRFVELLDSESTFLKWGAIIIIGNLAAIDSEKKIDSILDRFLEPISGPVMITAANTVGAAGKIGEAKPYLAARIVPALLQVEQAKYQTPECRNVALGHVITALDRLFVGIQEPQPVVAFVRRQLRNRRNPVRRKATAFLKKHRGT